MLGLDFSQGICNIAKFQTDICFIEKSLSKGKILVAS